MKLRCVVGPVLLALLVVWGLGKIADNREIIICERGEEIDPSALKNDPYTRIYVENQCEYFWVFLWIDDTGPYGFYPTRRSVNQWLNGEPLEQSKIFRRNFGQREIYAEAYFKSGYSWYWVGSKRWMVEIDTRLDWRGKYGEVIIFNDSSFQRCYVKKNPPTPLR